MDLKFKCLIIDHDDTAVNSTAIIHYPAHLEVLRLMRPTTTPITLEEWFLKNFHPGIMAYLTDELKMNEREIQKEYEIWREYTLTRVPKFYDGFIEALSEYRRIGGLIAVVSHSEEDIIKRDYLSCDSNRGLLPDIIFGWDYDEKKRKPSPYPVREILRIFRVRPDESLIVDDLKPGVIMAQASGVPFAAAGWGHDIIEIQEYMKKNSVVYFHTVRDFRRFILSP